MNLPKTTTINEQVNFKTVPDVIRTLQNNRDITIDVKEITNGIDYQALIRHLASLKQPFGVCIVRAKETK